ncbi:MAG: NADH-quinone oxidoreductase subunit NuoF [Dehalococcoidales bacterium]
MTFDEIRSRAKAEWEALECSDRPRIRIGTATCGRAAGALAVLEAIQNKLAQGNIEAIITQVGCIGPCYAEPIINIIKPGRPHIYYGNLTPELASQLIEDYLTKDDPRSDLALGTVGNDSIDNIPKLFDLPMLKPQVRIVLRNCGLIDPENINHYIANDGYSGLVRALRMKPEEVIEEIKKSGLRGRGGAGFPTGMKWGFCRKSPGTVKYVICNADEGDPGAFVDRTLLEGDPHAVLEGMLIGAYAIGATEGYIYIRHEYPLATEQMKIALNQAKERGLLGNDILGSGFSFEIKIRSGAGAFVCGEETALINSIEGKRGIPRIRPPFPAQEGLWAKPTNINNVETLANIPAIIERGADWYASIGTEKSKGTKLFSLSGSTAHTGVVEIPFGMSLQKLVEEIGGGIPNGHKLKALQPGGAMLGLIPASLVDRPIDFEGLIEIGSGVGSGGLVVIDESACMVDIACSLMSFAYSECCGKCTLGRLGTKQMLGILKGITSGKGQTSDLELLAKLGKAMGVGSLCPLGAGAPGPVVSTLKHFHDEYEVHIREHRCPAKVCQELT